ncbi:MAG TPA: FHA domain-containing protein [Pirellulales bacterium]|nr:FHA domain-containing protein [Pirellulales bacterium]
MALITLRVLDGADRGKVFEELSTPVTIGREEGNSVQLNDERVSRFHIKIQEDQEKLVLTDLESTNGTKVNGEDIQLRILRVGDMISVGRSVLLFGSREEIAERLAKMRGSDVYTTGTVSPDSAAGSPRAASLDFELNWSENPGLQTTLGIAEPPSLPDRMSPGQAAQLSEMLEYLHVRLRNLLASVRTEGGSRRVSVDERRWQALLELQSLLAEYLRRIGEPPED